MNYKVLQKQIKEKKSAAEEEERAVGVVRLPQVGLPAGAPSQLAQQPGHQHCPIGALPAPLSQPSFIWPAEASGVVMGKARLAVRQWPWHRHRVSVVAERGCPKEAQSSMGHDSERSYYQVLGFL